MCLGHKITRCTAAMHCLPSNLTLFVDGGVDGFGDDADVYGAAPGVCGVLAFLNRGGDGSRSGCVRLPRITVMWLHILMYDHGYMGTLL